MDLLENYEQYIQQYGDENGIIEKRSKKWKQYKNRGITVDYVSYSQGEWLQKILTCGRGFRWKDHERVVFVDGKPALIISEPYGIPQEHISKLINVGEELDFNVSLDDRFASHVGDTGCCIEIAPLRWIDNQIELEARS